MLLDNKSLHVCTRSVDIVRTLHKIINLKINRNYNNNFIIINNNYIK